MPEASALLLSCSYEFASGGKKSSFNVGTDCYALVLVILKKMRAIAVSAEPEMLHAMRIRRWAPIERLLGKSKQPALLVVE